MDRSQPYLLPPDMRDWLPAGHLVWFVLDVVAKVDTSVLHARHPNDGVGRQAYDPDMMLALLIYAYCTGMRSSRRIERLCVTDVAYRVICANLLPDHTTIARFRQGHEAVAQSLFVDVLALCAQAGLAQVGVVAVDGTKMGADASRKANRTEDQITAEVAAMFAAAAAADADDDRFADRGDDDGGGVPPDLADRSARGARLDAALRHLEAQRAARRAEEEAARAARAAAEAEAAARGHGVTGPRPRADDPLADAEANLAAAVDANRVRAAEWRRRRDAARAAGQPDPPRSGSGRVSRARRLIERLQTTPPAASAASSSALVNLTDPDSRIMKTPGGWIQGYNLQAAANPHGVILAAVATQDHNDLAQCIPMMAATQANLDRAGISEPIGTMLFDAGYCTENNLTAPGPDRLIATTKSWKLQQAARQNGPAVGDPPPDATPLQAMEHRLRTQAGAALYRFRQHTIEPVFGHTKANRGIRRLTRRGRPAVDAEWKLIATTNNILKLHTATLST